MRLPRVELQQLALYTLQRAMVGVLLLAGTALAVRGGHGSRDVPVSPWVWVLSLLTVAAAAWWARNQPGSRPRAQVVLQLVIDSVLTSVVCIVTGGVHAPFVFLYVPSIAAGAFQQQRAGALVGASLASAGVIAVAALTPPTPEESPDSLYTQTMFLIFAFFLVATLTGQLAELAERTGLALLAERRSSAMLASEHEMVLDRVRAAVLTLDHLERIVTLNPAALRLLGDVAGFAITDVLRGSLAVGTWEEARDAGRRWLCCADPLPDGGRVVVIEDVTEIQRMREVSARDERLVGVGRLAASMAHEIRNPLASLTGSLQLVAEDRPDRLLDIALREAQRLNRLVEEFLSVSRNQPVDPKLTDLEVLVEEVIGTFARDARFRETVRVTFEGGPAKAEVDPDRLRQVLWNLVVNGAQAMPRGGDIRVSLEERAEYEQGPEGVELRVIDQGPGIAEADRGRIFDPFFTTRSGGSGLGLALVEQIVRAHGGRIAVRVPEEGGTAFVVWLPKEANVG